jgi:hypothetical protein
MHDIDLPAGYSIAEAGMPCVRPKITEPLCG